MKKVISIALIAMLVVAMAGCSQSQPAPTAAPAKTPAQTTAAPQTEGGGDTVSVSQDALLLTEARRTAQSTPDVRADKVESLRQQVAAGTYVVDSRRIAESLIREEPGLFQL